jgi:hypothetical protein
MPISRVPCPWDTRFIGHMSSKLHACPASYMYSNILIQPNLAYISSKLNVQQHIDPTKYITMKVHNNNILQLDNHNKLTMSPKSTQVHIQQGSQQHACISSKVHKQKHDFQVHTKHEPQRCNELHRSMYAHRQWHPRCKPISSLPNA